MKPETTSRPRSVLRIVGRRPRSVLIAILGVLLVCWLWHENRVSLDDLRKDAREDLVQDAGPTLAGASDGDVDAQDPVRADSGAAGDEPIPATTIAGRVVDQDGAAVAAQITLELRPPRAGTPRTHADDGRFRFDDLDPDREYLLGVRVSPLGPGDRTTGPRERRLRPGGVPVESIIERRLFVSGRLWADRKSVGAFRIRAIRELPEPFACDVVSDSDGHFDLGPLRPGRYRIEAALGADGGWVPEVEFDVPAVGGHLFVPVLHGATLALHYESTPVAKVHWRPTGLSSEARSLRGAGSYSGRTGWIVIGGRPGQPPVSGTVFVRSGWRSALVEDVVPSTKPVELDIRYGRWFEGRVAFDEPLDDGDRRVGFVLAHSIQHGFTESYSIAADGTFEAIGLPPGMYELSYSADGKTSTGPAAAHGASSPAEGVILQAR